jgi:hypothetical protein
LKLLFENKLSIDEQKVIHSGLPIFSLTWILQRWYQQLPDTHKSDFLKIKIGDLMKPPTEYLEDNFVTNLGNDANEELASTTAIFATKK